MLYKVKGAATLAGFAPFGTSSGPYKTFINDSLSVPALPNRPKAAKQSSLSHTHEDIWARMSVFQSLKPELMNKPERTADEAHLVVWVKRQPLSRKDHSLEDVWGCLPLKQAPPHQESLKSACKRLPFTV